MRGEQAVVRLAVPEFAALLSDPRAREELSAELGTLVVVVEAGRTPLPARTVAAPAVPVVGLAADAHEAAVLAPWTDALLVEAAEPGPAGVHVGEGLEAALERLVRTILRWPRAATALVLLLRHAPSPSLERDLVAESALYSLLQAGAEFTEWRAGASTGATVDDGRHPLQIRREGDELWVTLDRPEVHNALSTPMRDALAEAFDLVLLDPAIRRLVLRGAGPSFCSGGDLREFGSAAEPVESHLVRMARSLPARLAPIAARTAVEVHGATMGAGIELAALAEQVTAREDTRIRLPELRLGLIPGSGGTASLPRRIGRHRTAWLALDGGEIDAHTALAWGLVDEVRDAAG